MISYHLSDTDWWCTQFSYTPFNPTLHLALHCLQTISPLHVSFPHFVIPLSDPAPLPHLLPSLRMTLDGRLLYLFPLSCYHHLISVNLFLSLRVSVCPCCDPCDISTVTPVTLHGGGHCPPYTTHGTEVLLMCECNAHTNGGGGGFSLMYNLLFENTALCGCVCVSLSMQEQKKNETERSEIERASNYMTDLASGTLWLNRAPYPDITPQSFHNILPLSLMPIIYSSTACEAFAAVYVYKYTVCVQWLWPHQDCHFWDTLLALVPSFHWTVCLRYISPRYIDPVNKIRLVLWFCVSSFESSGG